MLLKNEYNSLVIKVNAIQTTDTTNLVKIADYNTNIYEIQKIITDHVWYITTQEFNKSKTDNFAARFTQAKFSTKMVLLIL